MGKGVKDRKKVIWQGKLFPFPPDNINFPLNWNEGNQENKKDHTRMIQRLGSRALKRRILE